MIDDLLKKLEDQIEKHLPMSAQHWLEQAERLAVLIGNETDALYGLQKQVAQEKVKFIEQGKSVAEAKLRVEASEVYEQMLKQKAKVERVNEIIRLAKVQARMRNEEYNNQF